MINFVRAIALSVAMLLAAKVQAYECPAKFLRPAAVIFDLVTICAMKDVSVGKVKHAAHVTAQWLDNNQDGKIDELGLKSSLLENKPVILMSAAGFNIFQFLTIEKGLGDRIAQDLSAEETAPKHGRDASQEEIHHLIFTAGWSPTFPRTFSEVPMDRSTVYLTWLLAEKKGFYDYDDPTCDAECKVVEFFYLASAAYLGTHIDVAHDELSLKTRIRLKEDLPEVVNIIESNSYEYPRYMWPDGKYSFSEHIKLK